ncbi:type II toxin-antitoxin system VapC family toxin [Acidiphilium sp.]|uniref:type II toxin-antitoxin system VapC family toxin n=1 Tax=Acidiphilium sp. TaxID=527 RepID=UPI003D027456
MVSDTSALLAILLGETDAERFTRTLANATIRLISAVTLVELTVMIDDRKGEIGRAILDQFLAAGQFEIVAVTPQQAAIASEGFRNFGHNRHHGGLTVGDCFAYALARASGFPLLYKAAGFGRTDIQPAVTV